MARQISGSRWRLRIAGALTAAIVVVQRDVRAQASNHSQDAIARLVPIQFHSSDGRPLTFYWNESSEKFGELCKAPCWAWLPPGRHWISVSTPDGHARHRSIVLDEGDVVVGKYNAYTQTRVMGWGILAATIGVSGAVLAGYGESQSSSSGGDSGGRTALVSLGVAAFIAGAATSMLMIFSPAETSIQLRRQSSPPVSQVPSRLRHDLRSGTRLTDPRNVSAIEIEGHDAQLVLVDLCPRGVEAALVNK